MKITLESENVYNKVIEFEFMSSNIIKHCCKNMTVPVVRVTPVFGEVFCIPVFSLGQAQIVQKALEQTDESVVNDKLFACTEDCLDIDNRSFYYYNNIYQLAFGFKHYDEQFEDKEELLKDTTNTFMLNITMKEENENKHSIIELQNGNDSREFKGTGTAANAIVSKNLLSKLLDGRRSFATGITHVAGVRSNGSEVYEDCCGLYYVKTGLHNDIFIVIVKFKDTTWIINCRSFAITIAGDSDECFSYTWTSKETQGSKSQNIKKSTAF